MALTPPNDDAFFREVDDEVRRERMMGFAQRWGWPIAVAIGLFLVALGGLLWWRSHRAYEAGLDSEVMGIATNALAQGNVPGNMAAVDGLDQSSRSGYRATARLTEAAVAAQKGDDKGAAAAYQAISGDSTLPQPVRDLALVRGTTLAFDSLPPQQVIDRLKGLAQPGNPWFGSAAELTAIAWLKLGRRDKAGPLFAAIVADSTLAATLRARAAGMATALGQSVQPAAAAAPLKE